VRQTGRVTLTATWLSLANPAQPRLWMASDSRISDGDGPLLDQGVKLFEVPVIVRGAGESGFFDRVLFFSSIGVLGSGHTLVFQNVIGTLTTMFANLATGGRRPPSLPDLAHAVADVTQLYVRQLGRRRADAHRVGVIIGGVDLSELRPRAFRMAQVVDPASGMYVFEPHEVDLTSGRAHFMGEGVAAAEERELRLLEQAAPDAAAAVLRERAPLTVLREFMADPEHPTVGGQVEVGYTTGHRFTRVASAEPIASGRPDFHLVLNGAPMVNNVGECFVNVPGLTTGGAQLPLDL